MIDTRKIADLRLLLVRARVSQAPNAQAELARALDQCAGDLMAAAEAGCRIRQLFPKEPWPNWMSERMEALLLVRVRDAMRCWEVLEEGARKVAVT
jgi:hypothetical protein